MRLDNKELYDLLIKKNVLYLYHANTVATSITFIEQNGLLARGIVEQNKLFQSTQSSDAVDKVFNVWNDVFFDTVDIHGYFSRQNYYGPILFKFSIEFLLKKDFEIWITKNNPINWNADMKDEEKYFQSIKELEDNWDKYERQKKMITIKNQTEPILFDYLYQVIIDDPRILIDDIPVFNESVKALKRSLLENPALKNKFIIRECPSRCYCRSNYRYQVNSNDIKRLFFSKT